MEIPVNEIVCGSALDVLKTWPAEYIDCCVTSPPYWNLRSYMPDTVQIKTSLFDEEKEKIIKELTLLGIEGTIL